MNINNNDECELMITNIDKKNQAISLSMKALEKKNEDKALNQLDYLEPLKKKRQKIR